MSWINAVESDSVPSFPILLLLIIKDNDVRFVKFLNPLESDAAPYYPILL